MNKKILSVLTILLVITVFMMTACGKNGASTTPVEEKATDEVVEEEVVEEAVEEAQEVSAEDKIIKVASHVEPMTTIVKLAAEEAEKEGYTIELINVSDNIQPNQILNAKEIDANFFQHVPFMQAFNDANNGTLAPVQTIYDALVGFYSKPYDSIDNVPDNAKIAIPKDPANEGRALAILNSYDLIKLKDGIKYNGTVADIVENPHNFEFLTVDLPNLVYAYDEVDLVFNYPAYMNAIDLTPKNDALILEKSDGYFGITLVAREDNKDSEKIEALKKFMTSDAVKNFIVENLSEVTVLSF